MTYSQLLSDLTALNLHPLAETNVHAVTQDRGAAFLDFDTSAEGGLDDLKWEIKSEEPDEKGRTLRQYIEDAKLQRLQAAAWRGEAEKYKAELLALRKRIYAK